MAEQKSTNGVPDDRNQDDRDAIISSRPAALSLGLSDASWLAISHTIRQELIENMGVIATGCVKEVEDKRAKAQRQEVEKVTQSARDSEEALQMAERRATEVDDEEKAIKQKKKKIAAELQARRLRAEEDANTKARVLAEQERTRRLFLGLDAPRPAVAIDTAASASAAAAPDSPFRRVGKGRAHSASSSESSAPSSPPPSPAPTAAADVAAATPPVAEGAQGFKIPKMKKHTRLNQGISFARGAGAHQSSQRELTPPGSAISVRASDKWFCAVPLEKMAEASCTDFLDRYRGNVRGRANFLAGAVDPEFRESATLEQFVDLVASGGIADGKVVDHTTALLEELRQAFAHLPRGVLASKVSWSQEPVFTLRLSGNKGGSRREHSSSGYGSSAQQSFRSSTSTAEWRRRAPDRSDSGTRSASRRGDSSDWGRGGGRGGGRFASPRGESRRRRDADREESRTTRRRDEKRAPSRNTRRRKEDSPQRKASPEPSRREEASPSPLRGRARIKALREERRLEAGESSPSGHSAGEEDDGDASASDDHGEAEAG